MPRTDGFAVVRSVGEECMPPVIFVTGAAAALAVHNWSDVVD
jgi:hypothetical protein